MKQRYIFWKLRKNAEQRKKIIRRQKKKNRWKDKNLKINQESAIR